MLLLVLAVVWVAIFVHWLRSRSSSPFTDSVGSFRRHLNVLERTTPTTVRPANRLRSPAPRPAAAARPASGVRGQRIAAPGAAPQARAAASRPTSRSTAANSAVLRRRQAQKRRRDVFLALVAGAFGSLVFSLLLPVMWPVQGLFDVLLAGYVALLVRLRGLAAERELKVQFIPSPRQVHRPRPAYEMAAGGYEWGGTYGDLERRLAN